MKKYAVYLFDGTTQDRHKSEYKDWSNIVRLHALVFSHPPSDGVLLDMYGDGVGCRVNETVFGSTMGKGLEKRIEEAYYDLGTQVGNARKGGDDLHVFVFGFSRGAYAARLFCELVACCGVPSNEGSYDEAMSRLVAHDLDAVQKGVADGKYLSPPNIDLLGVFDTVKMTKYGSGVDISKLPNIVRHACHAMSYHERRSFFPLTRFAPDQSNVEEVWFVGSHTDIGGGYVKRGLADHSLVWMVYKANEYGLSRDELYFKMKDANVLGRRYFYPLISTFSTYRGLPSAAPENLPVATRLANEVICLPMHHELGSEDIERIINCILK